jgi:ketosteroid isomerase-like protein
MKIVLGLLLLIAPAFGADAGSKAEKEVVAAMDAWKTAMLKGDAAALDKLLSKDLTYVHSSAKNESKAECIENATKPGSVAKAIELHNPTYRVYGNTALVKATGDFTNATGTVTHLDFLMVWMKNPQGWQLAARQATKIP